MRKNTRFKLNDVFLIGAFFVSHFAWASSGITYHGRILKPDNTPVSSNSVQFKIQIRTPGSENCLLWEEQQTRDLSTTNGTFALTINDTSDPSRIPNMLPFALERVFSNRTNFSSLTDCSVGNTYNPSTADGRNLQVYFRENPTDPWEVMPATKVNFVPLALNTVQLEGYRATEFLKIDSASSYTPLTATQVNTLMDIIAGTNTQYLRPATTFSGDVSGTYSATSVDKIKGVSVSTTAPTNGQVLKYNGTAWAPAADDTSSSIGDASYAAKGIVQINTDQATSGLYINAGVLALPNVITAGGPTGGASTIPVITYDQKGRLTAVTTATVNDTTKLPLAGGTMTGNINMGGNNLTNATSVTATSVGTRNLVLSDNDTNTITLKTPADIAGNFTFTLPGDGGAAGKVLSTDGSGTLSWVTTNTALGLTANKAVIANGTGTALTAFSCTVNQVFSFDASGNPTCANVTAAGGFLNGGNSFGANATLGTNDNYALNIETNSSTRMTILNSGNVGIGTTSPTFNLSIGDGTANDGSIMALGYGTVGTNGTALGVSGAGTRMFWYPKKAAFRAGGVDSTQWDDANIGNYSVALGDRTIATGADSFAAGGLTRASGTAAVSIGWNNNSNANYTTTIGGGNLASGAGSTAIGWQVTASGAEAMALGQNVTASGANSIAIGAGASTATYPKVSGTNSLGIFLGDQANADITASSVMAILGGNVGVGTGSPSTILDVNGAITQRGMAAPSLSPAGQGRIYFDSTSNTFKVSQNGGAYSDLATTSGVSGTYVAKAGDTMTGPLVNNSNSASTALAVTQSGSGYAATITGGNVGIGTTSPSATLEVSKTSTANSNVTGTKLSLIHNPSSSGAYNTSGLTVTNQHAPTGFAIINSGNVLGIDATASAPSGAVVGSVVGGSFTADGNVTGFGAGTLKGLSGSSATTGGSYTSAYGGDFAVSTTVGALTNAYGVNSQITQSSGASINSITNAFGIYSKVTKTAAGGITNAYGVYIDSVQGSTFKYSLYASDAGAPSYFAGNVGIGTGSPNTALDVSGAISQRGMAAPSLSPAGQGRIYFDSTSNKFKVSENGGAYADLVTSVSSSGGFVNGGNSFGANASLGLNDNYSLALKTNNLTRATILNNGNVGIGTTSPGELLEVGGIINARHIYTDISDTRTYASTGATSEYPYGSNLEVRQTSATDSSNAELILNTRNATGNFQSAYLGAVSTTGATYTPSIVIGQQTGATTYAERIRIDTSGNVGIGTTTPNGKLQVNGTLTGKPAVSNATTSIDFATGNWQYTSLDCTAFTLYNLKDGTSYMFAVKGTTASTCSFTAYPDSGAGAALTVHLPPDHGITVTNKQTLYTFVVMGTDVYVSWVPGY